MSSAQVPYELYQFGAPVAEFTSRRPSRALLRYVAISAGAVVVGVILEVVGLAGWGASVAIVGGIFLAPGGFTLLDILVGGHQRVLVFKDGLGHVRGNQVAAMRWDEVREVYRDIRLYRTSYGGLSVSRHTYTLRSADGRTIRLTRHINEIEKLGSMLCQAITQAQLPRAVQTLNSGGALSFGPLSMSRQGIAVGRKLIPWSEIKGVRVINETVMVDRVGKAARGGTPVARVPNLSLFLTLAFMVDRTGDITWRKAQAARTLDEWFADLIPGSDQMVTFYEGVRRQ